MCFLKKHFHYLQMSCVALLSFKISIYEYGIIFLPGGRVCCSAKESLVTESKVKVPSCSHPSLTMSRDELLTSRPRLLVVEFVLWWNQKSEAISELQPLTRRPFLLIGDKYLLTVALACKLGSAPRLFFFCFVIMGNTFDSLPELNAWGLAQSHERRSPRAAPAEVSAPLATTEAFLIVYLPLLFSDGILVTPETE